MALATWWRGDPVPEIAPVPQFSAHRTSDLSLLARLAHLEVEEVERRIAEGSIPYLASVAETPAGYGWVATTVGEVIEIDLRFELPARNCYLWDFATLPDWRGHNIYPHLLQAILEQEREHFDRFWILYAPFNHASEKGIHKAGFQSVLDFDITEDIIKPIPIKQSKRAVVGVAFLQISDWD
ncbi:GNAT family N-acetyltransferase [Dictyobacter arantiisoli]|uniref:N-acetyltransferase domain-containing protein n=1 Tax=Dictyobacter arantiisoli TaxID=2014874 RepID=A0A5A5TG66_9CHLR|nr:GNAT family N-acetyltransferase [Dictyobacter arantiisoli]GCF10063.1 hypothetical protein KDI_36270 [Dictyobacter arantiisoli]